MEFIFLVGVYGQDAMGNYRCVCGTINLKSLCQNNDKHQARCYLFELFVFIGLLSCENTQSKGFLYVFGVCFWPCFASAAAFLFFRASSYSFRIFGMHLFCLQLEASGSQSSFLLTVVFWSFFNYKWSFLLTIDFCLQWESESNKQLNRL